MVERLFSRAVRHSGLLPQILSLLLLLAAADSAAGAPERSVPDPFLKITETGLTLDANGVPLDRILTRIAELYGAPIALEGNLATPVTLSFRNLRLQEAIRRLVADASFMILQEPPSSNGVPARPSKIWVYAAAPGTRTEPARGIPDEDRAQPMPVKPTTESASAGDASEGEHPTQTEIEAMATSGSPTDLENLGKVVADHPDAQMRYLAVTLLGDIPNHRAVLAIERGFGDEDPMFRSYLVETLGTNEALDSVRGLGHVIFGDPDPSVRLLAVNNLTFREEEPARDLLADAARDPDPAVRQAAATALRAFR